MAKWMDAIKNKEGEIMKGSSPLFFQNLSFKGYCQFINNKELFSFVTQERSPPHQARALGQFVKARFDGAMVTKEEEDGPPVSSDTRRLQCHK